MTERICKICNKTCKDAHSLAIHVRIHNMSSKQYYDTHLLKPGENVCKTCGKITKYINLSSGYKKHCNMSCTQHDPEITKKYKESFKKRDYADRRWSNGNLYKQLGFTLINKTKPSYYYVADYKRQNRMNFQKHKLVIAGFDPSKTEHEIMLRKKNLSNI